MSKRAVVLRMSQVPTYRALRSETNATKHCKLLLWNDGLVAVVETLYIFCGKERTSCLR